MPSNEQRRQAAKRKLDRQLARRAARTRRRRVWAVAGGAGAVVLVVGVVVVITVFGGRTGAEPGRTQGGVPTAAPVSSGQAAAAQPTGVALPTEAADPPRRPQPLPATVGCSYPDSGRPPAKPAQPPDGTRVSTRGTVAVTLRSSAGPIPATLDRGLAPCTVHSFVSLAEQDFYDDTPCHRLTTTPGLKVLQCGDPTGKGTGGPGYTIPDEGFPQLDYEPGYLAMAKTSEPDSGGSQFFVIYGRTQLPPKYTVFGAVSDRGLRVVDTVARAGVEGGGDDGKPAEPIRITDVTKQAEARPQ